MSVKISVVVPVYNMERYLSECLDSVLSQTLSDLEVIAINDGSTDSSLALLREYAEKDARVHIIDKKNEGVGAARNDGIAAANGEFIAFMDPDDYYPNEEVLKTLYEAAVEHGVKICGGRYQKNWEDGSVEDAVNSYKDIEFPKSGLFSYREYQADYGYTGFIYSTVMLKENGILFPLYGRFQDPPFFVKAMIAAERFYLLDEVTYCYRILGGKAKHSLSKTCDMLKGITDNLQISRLNGLSRLHYVTSCRLNEEGSYMVIQNIGKEGAENLLPLLLRANAAVDAEWLKAEGYSVESPFVLDAFRYMLNTAGRYEKLRQNKWVKRVKRVLGKD